MPAVVRGSPRVNMKSRSEGMAKPTHEFTKTIHIAVKGIFEEIAGVTTEGWTIFKILPKIFSDAEFTWKLIQ